MFTLHFRLASKSVTWEYHSIGLDKMLCTDVQGSYSVQISGNYFLCVLYSGIIQKVRRKLVHVILRPQLQFTKVVNLFLFNFCCGCTFKLVWRVNFVHNRDNFILSVIQRLRWSRGSVLAFGTQVRGFRPGRSRRIFQSEKILSTPSEEK